MGEYITHKNQEVKIGTCENLYYVSYQKYIRAMRTGMLLKADGGDFPPTYAAPDSGFRFRFPFPDEDKLPFGNIIEPHDRSIQFRVDASVAEDKPVGSGTDLYLELHQQKLVHRESDGQLILAAVFHNPETREMFRIEDKSTIDIVVRDIVRNHILNESNKDQRSFYRNIASRMLKGYRPNLSVELGLSGKNNISHPKPKHKRPGI